MYVSTSYLPSIDYISTILQYDKIFIEAYENYPKQTFRNRCQIATANGIQTLTVPIEKYDTHKCITRDIRISEHGNWRNLHWHALVSAYNLSPFFEYYADDFLPFYKKKYKYLIDYNYELLTLIFNLLNLSPKMYFTEMFEPEVTHDFRTSLTCRKSFSGIENIKIKPYYQVFSQKYGFIPNLSVVDLLFNMGNEAIFFLVKD